MRDMASPIQRKILKTFMAMFNDNDNENMMNDQSAKAMEETFDKVKQTKKRIK